jgi:hypothetical protein
MVDWGLLVEIDAEGDGMERRGEKCHRIGS